MTAILAEKPLLAALTLREAWRRLRRHLHVSAPFAPSVPAALTVLPPSLRAGRAAQAEAIYLGTFSFADETIATGRDGVFRARGVSLAAQAELHAFEWLAHHAAAGHALASQNARSLVDDWIALGRQARRGPANEPDVAARRFIAWLAHADIVLREGDLAFYRRFMRSLAAQARHLRRALHEAPEGLARLRVLMALAYASLCLPSTVLRIRGAAQELGEELDRQIFPDGGHVSRDPSALVAILADLLPLRETYVGQGQPVPKGIYSAIDRMLPAIRFFRHGDGTLALFNGAGVCDTALVDDLVRFDETLGEPIVHARQSGYHRLAAGAARLVCDTGCPPPAAVSGRAHAGTLAFEFSCGPERLVVNCGRPLTGSGDWRRLSRATAAHSTLTLADHSSARFSGSPTLDRFLGSPLVSGPSQVAVEEEGHNGLAVTATHDGYERTFGVLHERCLEMARDGSALFGRDRLLRGLAAAHQPALKARQATLRFHLHPRVDTRRTGHGFELTVGDQRWLFDCDQPSEVEDSVFFALERGPRRTRQIVVSFEAGHPDGAAWRFERLR
ncbi:heparinase II/III family protein [Aurantimonas sp. Leaf443]|uniref:heparinase II/III family protein n=1 Tax=Aurantimonas sp. Leaf443 TaxID=1736378 RepID=UPI0006FF9AD2|nr:heparinase II/III family protein [Aurantimonas sp. Leaf443]KQT85524.1 hypothetical protein ASG48_09940 [Aurantimonas sp. Leaf443]